MDAGDEMAPFRSLQFQEPLAIESKSGEPGEEHTRTTMDTDQELTRVVMVQRYKAHLD